MNWIQGSYEDLPMVLVGVDKSGNDQYEFPKDQARHCIMGMISKNLFGNAYGHTEYGYEAPMCQASAALIAGLIQEQHPEWCEWYQGALEHARQVVLNNKVDTIYGGTVSSYDVDYVRRFWEPTDYNDTHTLHNLVTAWNDSEGRTEEEVRTILDKAYVRAVEQDI